MGRIVVGVDGSESSLKALRWAARQAEVTGDRIETVISWQYPATSWASMTPGVPAEFDPEKLARTILDEAVDKTLDAGAAAAVDRQVITGHPAQVLVDRSEGATLLVVGDRGHSDFTAALIGSVSLHVSQHAKSPVVVVRGEIVED